MLAKLKNKKALVFIDQAIVSGSNFLLGILLARLLNIDIFGQYALLWMLVLFFSSVQQAAIVSPMYSLEPKRTNTQENHLSNIVVLQAVFAFVSMLVAIALLLVLPSFQSKWDIGSTIVPFGLAMFVFLLQDFSRRFFFIKEKYLIVVLMDIVAYCGLLITLLFLSTFNSLNLSIVFFTFALTFLFSFLLAFLKMGYKHITMNKMTETVQEYWEFSKWLSLSNIFQWLSGNLFIVIGGYILGAWSVGVIRIFQNTMGVFHVLFLALENFVPISAAKIYQINGYKNLLKYIYRYGIIGIISFILFGVVLMVFTPESLINLIYGDKYAQYGNLLYWYLVIYVFIYLGTLARFILRTIESTKEIYNSYMYSMIFSVVFAYPLVSLLAIKGIVVGTLLTQIIMTLFYFILIKKKNLA